MGNPFGSQELRDQIHTMVVWSQLTPVQRLNAGATPELIEEAREYLRGQD